jgi:hypothetical protein
VRRSASGTTHTHSLGVAALEDKVAQGAMAEVVTAIHEVDFLVCSYGFGRAEACISHFWWCTQRS